MAVSKTVTQKKSLMHTLGKEWQRNKYLYILSIPIIVYFIMFKYVPMFGLTIAFKDYNIVKGLFASEWVGLKYFKEFFTGIYFSRTLLNTLIISAMNIVIGFPVPIIFALMLNEITNNKFKKVVQTASYLPHFISMVVICGMITDFFSTDGLISVLISKFGGENMTYIGEKDYFRAILVGTDVWQGFGWGSIIYLSALSGIDEQLYEAAAIDGAGKWKQLLHVTLPGIANTIIIMLILRLGQVLAVGYEKIILLYSPQTYEVADVISSYTYRMGILNGKYSYSAAVGLFQSVVNLLFLVTTNKISKKYTETSLF
ncbi:MAG: sugar ABC transporter permease [Clostridia bacterium]|nr:sugar ABC transporter permease [Clostridia bacterium]